MKARLNLTIEQSVLEKAKNYASEKKTSVSQLVEDYLQSLDKGRKKKSLLDILDSLPKSRIDFPEDFNFKKEYFKANSKKYGF